MGTTTKKLDATGLSQVWAKILAGFLTKTAAEEMQAQINALIEVGAEANIIENVSVNGVALEVTDKGVNIIVPTGALASLDKVDAAHLEDAVLELINGKADKATTLAGYGITDAYTKNETDAAIKSATSRIYKVKGSSAFADLPTEGMAEGDVYNITDEFTTTDAFVEGAGSTYPAGTNIAYTENGWDVMAGTYDFSEYMKTSDLVDITEEEINEICKIS